MSANPAVSSEPKAFPKRSSCLTRALPVLIPSRTATAPAGSAKRVLGAVGIIVTLAVLSLGLYSVARYLF